MSSSPIPPRDMQGKISDRIEQCTEHNDRLSTATRASVELLNEYRAALITCAVTGQIDVATWGKRGETDRRLDQIEEEITQREASA